jgi:hypothetical protein
MDNQLRPLNLGEILDRTADLYRSRFLFFAGLASIFAAAMLAVELLHLGAIRVMGYPQIAPHLAWVYATSMCVDLLLISLLGGLSIAAFNRAVAWIYLGKPATVHAAVRSIYAQMRRYLWLMTVTIFRAWGPLIGVYVLFFGVIFAAGFGGAMFSPGAAHQPADIGPGAIAGALIVIVVAGLLLIPATVYGVIMSLRYSLAMPACVVEGLPAAGAIRRSIVLSEGSRGRIFVLGLLVGVVRLMLGLLFEFPMILLAIKHLGQPIPLGWMVYQQFGIFAVNALIGPIYSIGLTLFYYDQRIRKEGYDIEWMMQAAGLLPQQAASELGGAL